MSKITDYVRYIDNSLKKCTYKNCDRNRLNASNYCYLHTQSACSENSQEIEKLNKRLYPESRRTNVYIIMGVGTNSVKIGKTQNISSRFSCLQGSSPITLLLLAYTETDWDIEYKIHQKLKSHRKHGEWFNLSDEVIDFIDILKNEGELGILMWLNT